jgi:ATP-dependent DNA helicase RecG
MIAFGMILQDLKYHPRSLVSEMSERLPDIPFTDLQKCVRKMAIEGTLVHEGGRKYRRYNLP